MTVENKNFGLSLEQQSALGRRTVRKAIRRLIPLLFVIYVISWLDRINVGFAALQMNQDLGFGPATYGLAAALFFLPYALLEVPSNLILVRMGARKWIARIMITWGLVTVATAWVNSANSFYAMRLLLGAAEAGALPGLLFYLTSWFPARDRARAIATFMSATAISIVIGAPLSIAILGMDGLMGFRGWQWMFILEGLPAVLIGFVVLRYMTDSPKDAKWLLPEERDWLIGTLAAERAATERGRTYTVRDTFFNGTVWQICAICFFLLAGVIGVVLWLPQIIKAFGALSNVEVGLLTAAPYLLASFAMVFWARRSDATGERKWHLANAAFVGAIGLAGSALAPNAYLAYFALCVAAIGTWCTFGVFWAIPSQFLTGKSAAAGLALINVVGNLGSFAGPFLVGAVRAKTGSFAASLLMLSAFLLATAVISALLKVRGQASQVQAVHHPK